ncbi:unnamed protein product [Arabis nemorensis]|uniref:LOB domain-containing protein n=1 Tax=Arabis nemorensis TaxID=586526 RepID=A0A565BGE9_9BRAS|nr:unnamed protein product [Arabis nemorensis]
MASSGDGIAVGTGSPCGACKFLRTNCASDCIFAPYFSPEQGTARFAAIHKVFGASNVSKLLLNMFQSMIDVKLLPPSPTKLKRVFMTLFMVVSLISLPSNKR